jgi:arsenate reductase
VQIWFNPACSKCRVAGEAFDEAGVGYDVRRYLDDPPSPAELDSVLTALRLQPWELARLGEPVARELGLAQRAHDRTAWIELMCAHPALIQRPIVVLDDGTAHVVRDAETVDSVVRRARG